MVRRRPTMGRSLTTLSSADAASVTEGIQTSLDIAISGTPRRYRLTAATPVAGGAPVVYLAGLRLSSFAREGARSFKAQSDSRR